jgi:hypothetical protein
MKRAVKVVGKFLAKWKPHQIFKLVMRLTFLSLVGFNAGTIDEMVKGNLDDDRNLTQDVLQYLGVTDVLGSNHGIRLYRSIKKRLPSLLNLPELRYERFMGYDNLVSSFTHTDLTGRMVGRQFMGTLSLLANLAGQTALGAARRHGRFSVSLWHTHRLVLVATQRRLMVN